MKIESNTFFENANKSCLIAFGYHSEKDGILNNPPYIVVTNLLDIDDPNYLEVENIHTYDFSDLKNPTPDEIGFWKIKYKNQLTN